MSFTLSAADVKNLRDATGAGMMDCKGALTEAEGDFEKAIEILRKKGQKLSVKRADRDAKEGVVIAMVNEAKTRGVVATTPRVLASFTMAITTPSLASRSALLTDNFCPFLRRISIAFSKSPSASVRAPLQSIIPAPVASLRFLTSAADKVKLIF